MELPEKSIKNWREIAKSIGQGVLAGALLGGAFVGGFFYNDYLNKPGNSTTSFDLLNEADALLEEHYLHPMPDEDVRVHGAVRGLVASLEDPYTFFIDPQDAEVDTTNLAGRFGGIGAELGTNEQGQFVIVQVYRDNPAYEAGVQAGDIILAVDGVEVDYTAPDMNDLLSAIRGEIGEPVILTLLRGDETLDIEIIRAEVLIPSVFWEILEADPRMGYIQLVRFTDRSPDELRQAIAELEADGAQAYILDLRNNGGGLVDSAVGVAGEFLNGDAVLYEQRQGASSEKVFNASSGGLALDVPLVVLVNENTASASEIVAGAFHDRERATLIGTPTFGKGSVQLILALSDGSSIHVTNAQWFTPDHHPIDGQGLQPDVLVELSGNEDTQLAAAIEVLDNTLAVAETDN